MDRIILEVIIITIITIWGYNNGNNWNGGIITVTIGMVAINGEVKLTTMFQ